jgi:hypothetical protein
MRGVETASLSNLKNLSICSYVLSFFHFRSFPVMGTGSLCFPSLEVGELVRSESTRGTEVRLSLCLVASGLGAAMGLKGSNVCVASALELKVEVRESSYATT